MSEDILTQAHAWDTLLECSAEGCAKVGENIWSDLLIGYRHSQAFTVVALFVLTAVEATAFRANLAAATALSFFVSLMSKAEDTIPYEHHLCGTLHTERGCEEAITAFIVTMAVLVVEFALSRDEQYRKRAPWKKHSLLVCLHAILVVLSMRKLKLFTDEQIYDGALVGSLGGVIVAVCTLLLDAVWRRKSFPLLIWLYQRLGARTVFSGVHTTQTGVQVKTTGHK